MKGTISKTLEEVLRDPKGREQLRNYLIHGQDGRIVIGNKAYTVRVDVQKDVLPSRKDTRSVPKGG